MMARLRLREELFPRLFLEQRANWIMPGGFYPTELSEAGLELLRSAVAEAATAFSTLSELEASDLLARVCEAQRGSATEGQAEEALRQAFEQVQREFGAITEVERAEVLPLGGLCVLGTERHESRRIDNQLRGRAGRQGDPGASRFYLSLTDSVFRVFGGDAIKVVAEMGGPEDVPLGSPLLTSGLEEAQKQVETFFYGIRKDVFQYDEVMDKQRRVLYSLRRRALLDTDGSLAATMRKFNEENMQELVEQEVDTALPMDQWPFDKLARKMSTWFMGCLSVEPGQLKEVVESGGAPALVEWMQREGCKAIERKEALIDKHGPGLQHAVRRQILLMQVDLFWQRHLQNMGFLRNSAKLRAYGQQDPLVEFKREGYNAFLGMMRRVRRNSVFYLFNFEPRPLLPVSLALPLGGPALCGGNEAARLARLEGEMRSRLVAPGAEACDGRVLLPLRELESALVEAGLETADQRQRWVAASEGLELLEDNFARAVYVALKE